MSLPAADRQVHRGHIGNPYFGGDKATHSAMRAECIT